MFDVIDTDQSTAIAAQIKDAFEHQRRLAIIGGSSKAFYGHEVAADDTLMMTDHRGIIAYQPSELVITVRAGTPLAEVEALLAEHNQHLPFEPPHFSKSATIGGCIAAGLSGSARPYRGSVRDAVLGVTLANGQGDRLALGGQVMKNVAGYDISRLVTGSLGILAVILDVSIKVMPKAERDTTLVIDSDLPTALTQMRQAVTETLPVSAASWFDQRLYVRLSSSQAVLDEVIQQCAQCLPDSQVQDDENFWHALREQHADFFQTQTPQESLWRVSLPTATPADALDTVLHSNDKQWVDWGGALRWIKSSASVAAIRQHVSTLDGHATLFKAGQAQQTQGDESIDRFEPLSPLLMRLHHNLKQAFDPAGILNPGRMYREL